MPSDYQRIAQDSQRSFAGSSGCIGRFFGETLYADRTHFVYELLQNAEDALDRRAKATPQSNLPRTVKFHLYPDRLEFRHFGQVFNERDVRRILAFLEEKQPDELDQIGTFGIGFKSVHQYTDSPEIHSGDEHFCIDGLFARALLNHALPNRPRRCS